jgi:histidinol-phosphatase (PHP family)
MIANYHTHTVRCHHASGTEEDFVLRAIDNGLQIFGFSDHVPMPFPDGHQSGFRVFREDLEDYVRTVERLRDQYADRIRILLGFEAEYYPDLFEPMLQLLAPYDYDYLIMGQHFVGNEDGGYSGSPTTDAARLRQYVDQVITGLQTGKFTYLAHPDLLNYIGDPTIYDKEMTRLCRACLEMNIPLEVNLLGVEDGRHYPSDRFFRLAGKVGNPVILGCDAHHLHAVANADIIARGEDFCRRHGLTILETVPLRNPKS